jgi:hypothetical protein
MRRTKLLLSVGLLLPEFFSEAIVRRVLSAKDLKPDENAMYLYSNFLEMICSYDDRGRLVGEDAWQPDPNKAEIVKVDPTDVVTTAQAAERLKPLIKSLPSFDDMVLDQPCLLAPAYGGVMDGAMHEKNRDLDASQLGRVSHSV